MSALPTSSPGHLASSAPRLRLGARRLSFEIVHSFDALDHLRTEWDELVAQVGSRIYLTYDWCKVWWEHYGRGRDARVFLFREAEHLVGVVPMFIDDVRLGPANLRLGKIMGSDFTQAICDLPVCTPWAEAVIDEIMEQLIANDGCDAIVFGPMLQASGRINAVRAAAKDRKDLVSIYRDRVVTQQTAIVLPGSAGGYLSSLSKNQRFNLRKGWRRLTGDFDVEVAIVTEPGEAAEEFGDFVHMHTQQWQANGMLGHFGDWPGAEAFNRSLVGVMSQAGRLRLLRLRADDRVVARQYSFVFGNTCYCRLAARAVQRDWDPYGLGRLSLMKLFERLIPEGVHRVDVGTGTYEYKLRLGGEEHNVRSILIVAMRSGARRRARVFCALADAIDRFYYRLWYCRLAPRVPFRQRPLWPTWIRSRI